VYDSGGFASGRCATGYRSATMPRAKERCSAMSVLQLPKCPAHTVAAPQRRDIHATSYAPRRRRRRPAEGIRTPKRQVLAGSSSEERRARATRQRSAAERKRRSVLINTPLSRRLAPSPPCRAALQIFSSLMRHSARSRSPNVAIVGNAFNLTARQQHILRAMPPESREQFQHGVQQQRRC